MKLWELKRDGTKYTVNLEEVKYVYFNEHIGMEAVLKQHLTVSVLIVDGNWLDAEYEEYRELPKTVWDLKPGDTYFRIGSGGPIVCEWHGSSSDYFDRSTGNCFLTAEECEFEIERRKVITEMMRCADDDQEWNGKYEHHYIYAHLRVPGVKVSRAGDVKCGEIYFKSEESAEKCIKAVGEDRIRKYYIGVK